MTAKNAGEVCHSRHKSRHRFIRTSRLHLIIRRLSLSTFPTLEGIRFRFGRSGSPSGFHVCLFGFGFRCEDCSGFEFLWRSEAKEKICV